MRGHSTRAAMILAAMLAIGSSYAVTAHAEPAKNQPPSVKLKLGHYVNKRLGIGVTIDLTEKAESVAEIGPGKLKFDGETKVWKLKAQHGPGDRVDYVRDKGYVMLHAWGDGRRSVYVPDPAGGKSSDEIQLVRDGDADPL